MFRSEPQLQPTPYMHLAQSCFAPSLSQANEHCGQLGQYKFNRSLGRGAFGKVFQAKNNIDKDVAIKFIAFKSDKACDSTKKEAEILFDLQHPHIVRYYGSFDYSVPEKGKGLAIVTNYCSEGDLQSFLKDNHPRLELRLKWYLQLAIAGSYIHGHNIVHRDLKPANILVDSSNNLQICDVGLAWKILATQETIDFNEYMTSAAGTKYYMAPEVWQKHYTNKCDVFSLGLVFIKIAESPNIADAPTVDENKPLGKVMLTSKISKPYEMVTSSFTKKYAVATESKLCNQMLQRSPSDRFDMKNVEDKIKEMETNLSKYRDLTEQFSSSEEVLLGQQEASGKFLAMPSKDTLENIDEEVEDAAGEPHAIVSTSIAAMTNQSQNTNASSGMAIPNG